MALNGCCPTPSSVSGVQASEEQPMADLVVHRFDVREVTKEGPGPVPVPGGPLIWSHKESRGLIPEVLAVDLGD